MDRRNIKRHGLLHPSPFQPPSLKKRRPCFNLPVAEGREGRWEGGLTLPVLKAAVCFLLCSPPFIPQEDLKRRCPLLARLISIACTRWMCVCVCVCVCEEAGVHQGMPTLPPCGLPCSTVRGRWLGRVKIWSSACNSDLSRLDPWLRIEREIGNNGELVGEGRREGRKGWASFADGLPLNHSAGILRQGGVERGFSRGAQKRLATIDLVCTSSGAEFWELKSTCLKVAKVGNTWRRHPWRKCRNVTPVICFLLHISSHSPSLPPPYNFEPGTQTSPLGSWHTKSSVRFKYNHQGHQKPEREGSLYVEKEKKEGKENLPARRYRRSAFLYHAIKAKAGPEIFRPLIILEGKLLRLCLSLQISADVLIERRPCFKSTEAPTSAVNLNITDEEGESVQTAAESDVGKNRDQSGSLERTRTRVLRLEVTVPPIRYKGQAKVEKPLQEAKSFALFGFSLEALSWQLLKASRVQTYDHFATAVKGIPRVVKPVRWLSESSSLPPPLNELWLGRLPMGMGPSISAVERYTCEVSFAPLLVRSNGLNYEPAAKRLNFDQGDHAKVETTKNGRREGLKERLNGENNKWRGREGRREGGRKERRKGKGGREGRKEGREGRKEGRKDKWKE
ncbi:pnp, partial [Ophiophagus hannah]